MITAHRCINCMQMIEGNNCPHCGFPDKSTNESHQLQPGTMIRDRYQIGKVLGQGGFGITYLGWDTLINRAVAVKEFYPRGSVYRRTSTSLRVECVTDNLIPHYELSRKRFIREARALVAFQDIPVVVNLIDFIEENNTAYIVMEYVRGVNLEKYIQLKSGKLTVDETFRILKPVMEALAKVHKGNIVHRDISPDNIILDPMGGAKLLDFGAVRAVENPDVEKGLNKSTETILKHGFAPLEQYNTRGSLGPWTDEYAMCATIWYCLTGTIPEEASMRMTDGIDPDWSTIEGLPVYQQKALHKGISCRAKDRYENMDALIDALFPEKETAPEPQKDSAKKPSQDTVKKQDSNTTSPALPPATTHSEFEAHRPVTKKKRFTKIAVLLAFTMIIYAVSPGPATILELFHQDYYSAPTNSESDELPESINHENTIPHDQLNLSYDYTITAYSPSLNVNQGNGESNYLQYAGSVLTTVFVANTAEPSHFAIVCNEKPYYCDNSIISNSTWRRRDNKWNYFDHGGIMAVGWITIDGEMYYFEADGSMATGWQLINDEKYYFLPTGQMAVGTHLIDGRSCTFDSDGVLVSD